MRQMQGTRHRIASTKREEERKLRQKCDRTLSLGSASRKSATKRGESESGKVGLTRPLRCHQTRSSVHIAGAQPTLRLAPTPLGLSIAARSATTESYPNTNQHDPRFLAHFNSSYIIAVRRIRISFLVTQPPGPCFAGPSLNLIESSRARELTHSAPRRPLNPTSRN